MARPFPYTYISCPCAETPTPDPSAKRTSRDLSSKKNAGQSAASESGEEGEEQAFDPRSPRANFSLYPPEQLLFCEDCHQIKCPRCITEEIVCWYCPNCLFETPSSMVRSEGNRLVDTLSIAWFSTLATFIAKLLVSQMCQKLFHLSSLHGSTRGDHAREYHRESRSPGSLDISVWVLYVDDLRHRTQI